MKIMILSRRALLTLALLILIVVFLAASTSPSLASTANLAVTNTATPFAKTTSVNFSLPSTFGAKTTLNVPRFTQSGCLLVKIDSWSPSKAGESLAPQLAIIINGSNRSGYYARVDGNFSSLAPLWTSYAVTSAQVQSQTRMISWTVSVYNFSRKGTAKGTLYLEYPSTQVPCEFKIAASPTRGQVDLSWRYTGPSFAGFFLVERTTDGKTWSPVAACKQSPTNLVDYACKDTKLPSDTTYYYRACAVTSPSSTKCSKANLTPTYITPELSVKVP